MIYVVGIGSCGGASLNANALGVIAGAGLLVGTARFLSGLGGAKAKRLEITGGLGAVADKIEEFISEERKEGRRATVAVLATGDPLLFGIAGFIIKRFGKRGVTVLPNISIVAEAFAIIKEPRSGAVILSAHGRPMDELFGEFPAGEAKRKIAIFTDSKNSPAVIARKMIARAGGGPDPAGYTAYVVEAIGTKAQRATRSSVAVLAERKTFEPLNILLLLPRRAGSPCTDKGRESASEPSLSGLNRSGTGLPDHCFISSTGMITKAEVRVVTLSKLDISPRSVVWDIGAGCGSVTVEAARLAVSGTVFAFEKRADRAADIKENISRFGLCNVRLFKGGAPDVLKAAGVLRPTRVFVGGGGGVGGAGINAILRVVLRQIRPCGIIVVNSVTIETACRALAYFEKRGWHREMVQVAVSRAKPVGGVNILSASNPVFIITAKEHG